MEQLRMEQGKRNCIKDLYRHTLFCLKWMTRLDKVVMTNYLTMSVEWLRTVQYWDLRVLYDMMSSSRLAHATSKQAQSSASSRKSKSKVSSSGRNACWLTKILWDSKYKMLTNWMLNLKSRRTYALTLQKTRAFGASSLSDWDHSWMTQSSIHHLCSWKIETVPWTEMEC